MRFRNEDIVNIDLRKLYTEDLLSTREIGVIIGASREYVRRQLAAQDIPIRHGGEAVATQWVDNDKRRAEQSAFGKLRLVKHGEEHANWKGGLLETWSGYILEHCPGHPRARQNKVRQHVLVMEKHIGRYLKEGEIVHHKNGNRKDNRIENLELMTALEHNRFHAAQRHKLRAKA